MCSSDLCSQRDRVLRRDCLSVDLFNNVHRVAVRIGYACLLYTSYVIAGYLKPEEDVFDCETVKITECYTYEQMRADMDALAAA